MFIEISHVPFPYYNKKLMMLNSLYKYKVNNNPYFSLCVFFRLNKIGKNPNMVAQRSEDMQHPESKTISAVVNALAEQAEHVSSSEESMQPPDNGLSVSSSTGGVGTLGKALHRLNLPRPKSVSNFSSQELHVSNRTSAHGGPPMFHKSDTFHRESSFH